MSIAAPRLAVGVIGTGRVGSVLGAALDRAGHPVVAASGVSKQSQDRARRLLPGVVLRPPDEVAAMADLILLAVPDDELADLVSGLATTGTWRKGQIVAHTSGAHGLDVLQPAAERGVMPLALHPAMTFTGRPEDVDRLNGAIFGITAYPDYRAVAETLVLEMGGEPVWVPDSARPLYHAALSHAANHLVTLLCDAVDLLADAGVDQPSKVLSPLVFAAADNALRLSDAALTGPVSRGDVATVRSHVTALRAQDPATVDSYLAMARRTAVRAYNSGRINDETLVTMIDTLEREGGRD
ncbi:MAG: putative short-subunit dehydrogenase-like oxidoreductase [Pseudonocardiales bacterium]|nr:putative short-subunit dehydrogenase-like oxidoreductase [Pseudonocardiales bacterium]